MLSCDTPLLIIFYFGMIQNFQNLQIQFLGGGAILAKCSYVTSSVSLPAPFAKNTCNQCKNLPLTIPCTGAFTHFGDKTTSFTFEAKFTISFLFDASPDNMFSAINQPNNLYPPTGFPCYPPCLSYPSYLTLSRACSALT